MPKRWQERGPSGWFVQSYPRKSAFWAFLCSKPHANADPSLPRGRIHLHGGGAATDRDRIHPTIAAVSLQEDPWGEIIQDAHLAHESGLHVRGILFVTRG